MGLDISAQAWVEPDKMTALELRRAGWQVEDGNMPVRVAGRVFESVEDARSAAERDLPAGTPVGYGQRRQRRFNGGFIVGHPELHVGEGARVPAYILWPGGREQYVASWTALKEALLAGLDEGCARARALGHSAWSIRRGRKRALKELAHLDADGPYTEVSCGPIHAVGVAPSVNSVAELQRDGFIDGWESPYEPVENRWREADVTGRESVRLWRDGVRAGVDARARSRLS